MKSGLVVGSVSSSFLCLWTDRQTDWLTHLVGPAAQEEGHDVGMVKLAGQVERGAGPARLALVDARAAVEEAAHQVRPALVRLPIGVNHQEEEVGVGGKPGRQRSVSAPRLASPCLVVPFHPSTHPSTPSRTAHMSGVCPKPSRWLASPGSRRTRSCTSGTAPSLTASSSASGASAAGMCARCGNCSDRGLGTSATAACCCCCSMLLSRV